MPPVMSTSLVDDLLKANAPVAIGVSGGKDSQSAALATFEYLDRLGHVGPRLLVHADLGSVEWDDSMGVCQRLEEHLGVELLVVRRKAGDLMERWEARWRSSVQRYEELSTVTLVPCWSTPSMRFCTSEMKTHVIIAALKKRFKGMTVVNVTGVRRSESAARAKSTIASEDAVNSVVNWRPIVDWIGDDVFAKIDASGLALHPAYQDFGMSRVSCRFCIMSNIFDLTMAAAQPESHALYRRMVGLEARSSFAFQGSRWLGDVAPDLLSADQRDRLAIGKQISQRRMQIEKQITGGMLYSKGWPTRMLTDTEADILASVRSGVADLFGFNASCLDRDSIHSRYADLMAKHRERRAA